MIKHTNGTAILAVIIKANYVATEEQVEQLAHVAIAGEQADLAYFRVLIAHMQGSLGKGRSKRIPPQEPVLDAVHAKMYEAALRGVGPLDMDQTERHRLGTKFRTAASTIRFAIRGGLDMRTIDVATVTKNGLRKAATPAGADVPEGTTRTERAVIRDVQALQKSVLRLARGDPEKAIESVEALMDELQKLLDDLGKEPEAHQQTQADVGGQTTTIVAGRSGVGRGAQPAPMLHRGA